MEFKVCLVGLPGVGKSTIIKSLFKDERFNYCVPRTTPTTTIRSIQDPIVDDRGNMFYITDTPGICEENRNSIYEAMKTHNLVLFVTDFYNAFETIREVIEYSTINKILNDNMEYNGFLTKLGIIISKYNNDINIEKRVAEKSKCYNINIKCFNAFKRLKYFNREDCSENDYINFDISVYRCNYEENQRYKIFQKFYAIFFDEITNKEKVHKWWNLMKSEHQNNFFNEVIVSHNMTLDMALFCIRYYNNKIHNCSKLGIIIMRFIINNELDDYKPFYGICKKMQINNCKIINKLVNITKQGNISLCKFIPQLCYNNEKMRNYFIKNFNKYITEWYKSNNIPAFNRLYYSLFEHNNAYKKSRCKEIINLGVPGKYNVPTKKVYYSCVNNACNTMNIESIKFINSIDGVHVNVCDFYNKGCKDYIDNMEDINEDLRKNNISYTKLTNSDFDSTEPCYVFEKLGNRFANLINIYNTRNTLYKYEYDDNNVKMNIECVINEYNEDNTTYKCKQCNKPLKKSYESSIKYNCNYIDYSTVLSDEFKYYIFTRVDNNYCYKKYYNDNPIQPDEFVDIIRKLTSDEMYLIYNKMQIIKYFIDGRVSCFDKSNYKLFDFEKYIFSDKHMFIRRLKKDKELYSTYMNLINTFLKRIGVMFNLKDTYKNGYFIYCVQDLLN